MISHMDLTLSMKQTVDPKSASLRRFLFSKRIIRFNVEMSDATPMAMLWQRRHDGGDLRLGEDALRECGCKALEPCGEPICPRKCRRFGRDWGFRPPVA